MSFGRHDLLGHRMRPVLLLLLLLGVLISPIWQLATRSWDALDRGRGQADARDPRSDASVPSENPAVPIVAATVERRDVAEYLSGIGTVEAVKTGTVGSRVDGQLLTLQFKEGQPVHAGEKLTVPAR